MPNDKLRLNLADLRLKSFGTTDGPPSVRGTVEGMEQQCGACTFCSGGTCGQATYGCLGASQTDTGCDDPWWQTWGPTACEGTCYDETCAYTCTGPCPNGTCVDTCAATCQNC